MQIHPNILSTLGKTPLVALNRMNPNPAVKLLAKLEAFNPGGSIKDRVAMAMIQAAEQSGELTPDKIIIEATSGNTGIGLAMVCAVKGYRLRLLMPETASEERRKIMLAYGAEIQLTPGHLSTDGAIEEAYRMAREEPDTYVLMDQFNNPASIDAHYLGTGLEIWKQTEGQVTHVVSALGTSGTAMGVTKRMKEMNPAVQVIAVEPFPEHKIQGLKNMQASYPPGIYNKHALDRIVHVEDEEAFETTRRLAREEGIFAGMSCGAAVASAIKLIREELTEGVVVVILPDSGERYLSTPLFAPVEKQGVNILDASTSKQTVLSPGKDGAGFFTMGPPLDNLDDLDVWRRVVLLDALGAYLESRTPSGRPARVCVGVADMDDRAVAAARRHNLSLDAFRKYAVEELQRRAALLGLGKRVEFAPAGPSMETVLNLTRKLLARGAAYEKLRSVYFDVLRDSAYGRMSAMDLDKLFAGKTVDLADYIKDNPKDFTLLKRATLQDLKIGDFVATEWGNVRPSWFVQHAAVAQDRLPELTAFASGEKQRFPHMENFRAIWSLARAPLPQAWMVFQPVVGGDKGAPAPGLDWLLAQQAEPGALRMWLLSTSYRKQLTCTPDNLAMWRRNWLRVQNLAASLTSLAGEAGSGDKPKQETEEALAGLNKGFRDAMEDDLALHHFWPSLFTFCRQAQSLLSEGKMAPAGAEACLERLFTVDAVLRVLDRESLPVPRAKWPAEAAQLVEQRNAARDAKDYTRADSLRAELEQAGFRVEDTSHGARLFPVSSS